MRVASNGVNSHSHHLLGALGALGAPPVAVCHPAATGPGRRRLLVSRLRGRLGGAIDARVLSDLTTRHAILVDAIRRQLPARSPDVVHAQDFVAAAAVWDALGDEAPPVVLAHHVNGLAADELMQRFGLTQEARAVDWTRRQSARAFERAARVVAVSPWAADVLRERAGLGAGRLDVVENGVPVSRLPPDRARQAGLVVAVGQVVERKGFDVLVAAARDIALQARVPGFEVVVLGDGPQRTTLAALAASTPPVPVRFPGAVGDVASWLARASVFCLPSRAENLPMALLEAMAQGTAVVASDVGGVGAVVGRGEEAAGLLVPAGDADALAAALVCLLGDEEACSAMGRRGHARIRLDHSLEGMAAAWLRQYRDALA